MADRDPRVDPADPTVVKEANLDRLVAPTISGTEAMEQSMHLLAEIVLGGEVTFSRTAVITWLRFYASDILTSDPRW